MVNGGGRSGGNYASWLIKEVFLLTFAESQLRLKSSINEAY